MSNSSIIENIHNLLEEHSSRIKRIHFRAITFLTILFVLAAMVISTESTYAVSRITTTNGKGTPLVLSKMTNTSRDSYSKDPRIAMILRIKGLNYTDYFKVTTSAGGHGTVGKTRNVKWGRSTAVEITPDSGYRIGTVKLNGKSVKISKTAASYTIRNIKKSQKLEVTFEKIPGYTKPPEQENPDSTNKNNQNGSGGDAEAVSMTESEESKGNNTEGRNETGSENLEASTAAGKDSAAE